MTECDICYDNTNYIFLKCDHEICFRCYKNIHKGIIDFNTNSYIITCPYCRKKEHVKANKLYGKYVIPNYIFPEKGKWLPMTEQIRTGIISIFHLDFSKEISHDEIINGIKIAFTSKHNSTLFVIGTVKKFENGFLHILNINLFQHNGTYYNSYPPNKIYKIDNSFIIYTI